MVLPYLFAENNNTSLLIIMSHCFMVRVSNQLAFKVRRLVPSCLIPNLLVVFTRQLEILVTTLLVHNNSWTINQYY